LRGYEVQKKGGSEGVKEERTEEGTKEGERTTNNVIPML
jgi:hypothetical protein